MSAFALRKRLLNKEPEVSSPDPDPSPSSQLEVVPTGSEDKTSPDLPPPDETNRPTKRQRQVDLPENKIPPKSKVSSAPKTRRIQRSSFFQDSPKQKKNGSVSIELDEGKRVVILGSYGITVSSGEVTIAGATLRASPKTHWVHAPVCHALPVIRCSDEASIAIESHPAAPSLRNLERLSLMFRHLWSEQQAAGEESTSDVPNATFQIIYSSEHGTSRSQDLVSPPEWNRLISDSVTDGKAGHDVFFVCGPKSSGKSTFSRLLANRILTDVPGGGKQKRKRAPAVAVLDIDPGQPEYGTPGTLSLVLVGDPNLAPSFCHPYANYGGNRVIRAHDILSISPAADSEHYIECVLDLYAVYRRDLRNRYPLIINTPGWIQGSGLENLVEMVQKIQPTQIIYMSDTGPKKTVKRLKSAQPAIPFLELPSQTCQYKARVSSQLRIMQTMSYFHLDLAAAATTTRKSSNTACLTWNATPITAMRPWTVPYTGTESGILGVLCYNSQAGPESLRRQISGTVVSIVAIEQASAFKNLRGAEDDSDSDAQDNDDDGMEVDDDGGDHGEVAAPDNTRSGLPPVLRSSEGIPYFDNPGGYTVDPQYSRSLGAAFIHSFDPQKKVVHLMTPVAIDAAVEDVLRQDGLGVVLVCGKADRPTWAYTEEQYNQRAGAAGVGARGDADKDEEEDEDEHDDDEGGTEYADSDLSDDNDDDDDGRADGEEEEGGAEDEGGRSDSKAARRRASEARRKTGSGGSEESKIPWVVVLKGGEKRMPGSRVRKVRRDLGRRAG